MANKTLQTIWNLKFKLGEHPYSLEFAPDILTRTDP